MATHDLEHGEPAPARASSAEAPVAVELLYFAECPNYLKAQALLQEVLVAEGIRARIALVAVETQAEAERQRFSGSPTIRINGDDIVPLAPDAQPGLACRFYRTAEGGLAPIPPRAVIVSALAAHRLPH
jgi:hypothetical protein